MCYECGQTGHIKPNCPKLKGNVRVVAAHAEDILEETENMEDEEGTSGINQEDQQEVDHPSMTTQTADEWVEEASQYNWDEGGHQSDGGGHTYRMSAIRIPTQEDIPVKQVCGVRFTPVGKPLSNERAWQC